jgi:hypothetical protein
MMMDPSYIVCSWSRNHCIVINPLSNTMKIFVEFTEHAYGRLGESLRGVTEDELRWHPVPEMNTTGKILRHSARISYVLLPQVVEGTTKGNWDDDYEKNDHGLPEMLRDIEVGREKTLKGLHALKSSDLDAMIPLWGGTHRRAEGVNVLVGELVYHAGQIALIRGAYSRIKRH